MEPNIALKKKILTFLRQLPHYQKLQSVILFGSQSAGKAGPLSDIDLCLSYNISNTDTLRRLLYQIRGRLPERYDIQIFQLLPLTVRREVLRGTYLFIRSRQQAYDTTFRTFEEYADFAPRYRFNLLNTPSHPRRALL